MAEAEATSEIAAGLAAESRAALNEIKLRRRACNVWGYCLEARARRS
jgi:hypothetical protein